MDVHEADLATPERARLGALEGGHRSAAVGHRAVEEPGSVRPQQVPLDRRQVVAGGLRVEHVGGDGVDPRQDAVRQPGAGVARMDERLGVTPRGGVVVEQVAGHQVVDDHVPADRLAGAGGQGRGTVGEGGSGGHGLEALGQCVQRLHLEDGRPGGGQASGEVGVRGLERVVPVAVAVGRQRRPGDGQRLDPVQRPREVLLDRRRCGGTVVADEGHLGSEDRCVADREQVLTDRQQRPVDDVAVGVLLAVLSRGRHELERLRPVAAGVLGAQHPQQHIPDLVVAVQCGQQADRPLADVAGAPPATGVLLEPAGREVVHQGVVGEPREGVGDGRDLGRLGGVAVEGEVQRAGEAGPEVSVAGARSCVGGVEGEPPLAGGLDVDDQPVLVAHDIGLAGPPEVGGGCLVGPGVEGDQQPRRGTAQDPDGQGDLVPLRRRARLDLEQPPVGSGVPPHARVQAVAPRAREVEQLPARVVGVAHQHAQSLPAEQARIAAPAGQQGIAPDVADGDLRVERAAHPDRRRHAVGVGGQGVARPQDLAVGTEHLELAGGGDHLAARGAPGRRGAVGVVLGRARVGGEVEHEQVVRGQRDAGQGGRGGQHRGRAVGQVVLVRGLACGTLVDEGGRADRRLDVAYVVRAGGCRVVRQDEAEEPGAVRRARREHHGLVLHRGQGVLVLQPRRGEVWPVEPRPHGSTGGPLHQLEHVGGPVDAPTQRAHDDPGHLMAGHVLPHGQCHPVLGGVDRGQVEVLADVVLVVGHRAGRGERGVLGQDGVDPHRCVGGVDDLEVPRPGRLLAAQDQRQRVVETVPPAGGTQGVVHHGHAARRRLAEQRGAAHRAVVEDPQVHVGGTRLDARGGVEQEAETARLQPGQGAVGIGLGDRTGRALESESCPRGRPLVCPHGARSYQS